jgi:hypothetical protein
MTRQRPFGITLLAILGTLAAFVAVYHTLQMLHILPVWMGAVAFFTFDLLGAILWGVMALIWVWVVIALWNLNPQAWLFVVALSVLNLIMAGISILGASTWDAMLPAILVNGIVLIYAMTPGVKSAFGTS